MHTSVIFALHQMTSLLNKYIYKNQVLFLRWIN